MKKLLLLASLLLLLWIPAVRAEPPAADLTKRCTITATQNKKTVSHMTNDRIRSLWDGGKDGTLTVVLPEDLKAQGVQMTFFCEPPALTITAADGTVLADWRESFYTAWIPFSQPANQFTIARPEGGDLLVSRLKVMGEGVLPEWVQQWRRMEPGTAEMLMIVTHPDDDLLWFGGLLPTYAGELGKRVQVAYMVARNNRERRVELLDALWHCGVEAYPEIGAFLDKGVYSIKAAYFKWGGEEAVDQHITRLIRKWQPQVVVTQDVNGEYGHVHHKIMARSVVRCVTELCGSEDWDPESAAEWGLAHPQKLYVHLGDKNLITMDWEKPLSRFGGKTSLDVAREAFKLHISQQKGKYHISLKNATRCDLFSLCYTTVGEDSGIGDLFEHVEP